MMRLVSAAAAILLAASPLFASPVQYIDTTVGGPTWNRPVGGDPPTPPTSGVGTSVPYQVQPFYVSASGNYDFLSVGTNPAGWDNYLFLYQGQFDPNDQFNGVIIGNDDFPGIGQAGFDGVPLTAGTQYFLVTSGFSNFDEGQFTNTITGSGNNTAILGLIPQNTVPEPATMAVFGGMALAGMFGYRRRKAARA